MLSNGVKSLKDSTKKHLCRKLELEFGNSVDIFSEFLAVPGNITLKEVVLENQTLHRELK